MEDTERDIEGRGLSRRDFLKASAAAAAAAGTMEYVYSPEIAAAYENDSNYQITFTTCPYCSASCGQRVVVDKRQWLDPPTNSVPNPEYGNVIDIYGDFESPFNSGGLCAKGAGSYQLVRNPRRLGVGSTHPVDPAFAYTSDTGTYPTGVAYRCYGTATGENTPWERVDLDTALGDIATKMVTARNTSFPTSGSTAYNSNAVAFFGSSHLNNEPCYMFRKLIANFGTTNTEHQARI